MSLFDLLVVEHHLPEEKLAETLSKWLNLPFERIDDKIRNWRLAGLAR